MARNKKRLQAANVKQMVVPPQPATAITASAPPPAAPVPTADPLLLTIADVCALLNVSRSTIDRLDKSGKLPGRVKLGGQVRYHRETLEQWLKQQVLT
jgi:excisionase family DNA binding protein